MPGISLIRVATLSVLAIISSHCLAQRGGGGMRGGQNPAGGMMGGGGQSCTGSNSMMSPGVMANMGGRGGGFMTGNQNPFTQTGTGFMNGGRSMNQSSGMGNTGCQRNQSSSASMVAGRANSNNAAQPTPQQFALAAMRFDQDKTGSLDSDELKQVATAVLAELNQRRPRAATFQRPQSSAMSDSSGSSEQMCEAFVARSLTFDEDKDGSLNVSETRKMAAALIRSLG